MDEADINWALYEAVKLTVISDSTVLVARIHGPGAFVLSVDDRTGTMIINGVLQLNLYGEYTEFVDAISMGQLNGEAGKTITHMPH
jgi:hypothetical protein